MENLEPEQLKVNKRTYKFIISGPPGVNELNSLSQLAHCDGHMSVVPEGISNCSANFYISKVTKKAELGFVMIMEDKYKRRGIGRGMQLAGFRYLKEKFGIDKCVGSYVSIGSLLPTLDAYKKHKLKADVLMPNGKRDIKVVSKGKAIELMRKRAKDSTFRCSIIAESSGLRDPEEIEKAKKLRQLLNPVNKIFRRVRK